MPRCTADTFWTRLQNTKNGCREFVGCRDNFGYGCVGYNDKVVKTHRLAYTLAVGPIPKGLCVCHKCDNPPCCNPEHLFLGTKRDNAHDAITKKRHKGSDNFRHAKPNHRGAINGRAKLTEVQVRHIRSLYQTGLSQQAIADNFGMNQTTISDIVRRQLWPHVD